MIVQRNSLPEKGRAASFGGILNSHLGTKVIVGTVSSVRGGGGGMCPGLNPVPLARS